VEAGILVTSTWLEGFDPALPLRLSVTVPYLQSASAVGESHVAISGATATVPFEAMAFDGSEIHLAGAGGSSSKRRWAADRTSRRRPTRSTGPRSRSVADRRQSCGSPARSRATSTVGATFRYTGAAHVR